MGGKRLRRNLLCLLGAAAVLLISLVPARYSNEVYAYLPFFALLCLLLLSLAGTLLLRRGVRVTSESQDMECRRGESLPMAVQVRNDGPLSCPQARAWLYVSNLFREEDTVTPASFTLAGRSVSDFSFDIKMTHVGEYRAGLRDMEVYGFLGLFRLPVPGRRDLRVTVLPREVLPRELELSDKMLTESHDQHKSMVSDGFDYSGVREYAMGDSMKRIHWKLSAHSLDYMTKITETSRRNDLTVLLDISAPAGTDGETLACLYDALVETALSFTRQAAGLDTEYSLIFPDRRGELCRTVPKGREDERELLHRLATFQDLQGAGALDGAQMIQAERKTAGGSSNLIVCTALVTEELLRELVSVKQQRRSPTLCYILPHGTDRAGREAAMRPLRLLDEYGIGYLAVLADGGGA